MQQVVFPNLVYFCCLSNLLFPNCVVSNIAQVTCPCATTQDEHHHFDPDTHAHAKILSRKLLSNKQQSVFSDRQSNCGGRGCHWWDGTFTMLLFARFRRIALNWKKPTSSPLVIQSSKSQESRIHGSLHRLEIPVQNSQISSFGLVSLTSNFPTLFSFPRLLRWATARRPTTQLA